jgi:cell division protein FtsB
MNTEELLRKNEELTARVAELEKEITGLKADKDYWMKADLDKCTENTELKAAIKTIAKLLN